MRIVAVSYYDEIFVPVVREICERTGWTVCDWLTAYPSQDPSVSPERAFPGAAVHVPQLASRGILPEALRSGPQAELDAEVLERMAPYENMFMRMLDIFDPDGHSFSGRERRFVYFDMLRAALTAFRRHEPGLFLAGTIPHSLHDYLLYAVCKAHGVPTLVYVAFSVPGYLLLHSSMDEGNPRLGEVYRGKLATFDGGEAPLPPDLDRYLSGIRRDYGTGEPWYVKLRDHGMLARRAHWVDALGIRPAYRGARSVAGAALRYLRAPRRSYEAQFVEPLTDLFKRRGEAWIETVTTRHRMERVFAAGIRTKRALLREYRRLERAPDPGAQYVFVPLHYQPEASTSPMGGVFVDQLLMIRLLASCLPSGWRIYVKEHRTTFDPWLRGHFARDDSYYREIAEVPGVSLVPMEITSFDLIDRARAVATVTGTAGWEAVARGVPSICFGNAWYRECDGVFDGRTEAGCRSALSRIAEGYRPDPRKVRLFLQALAEVGVRADRDNTYILTDLTPAESRRATVEHFLREFPRMSFRGR